MYFTAEVIETKKAFKPNQKDDQGNTLPLGSILIRNNSNTASGQVKNVYARPSNFNRRIPFIGEHVLVMQVPLHDKSAASIVSSGYIYISPYNATDDLVLHQFPKLWDRSNHYDSKAPTVKSDKKEIGYNYIKSNDLKSVDNLQPFEGDDIYEGRFGQSLRFGTSIEKDTSVYDKKPTWKGKSNGDPIILLRLVKPKSGANRLLDINSISSQFNNKYTIENIDADDASIYLTSTQRVEKLKGSFSKNTDIKTVNSWAKGSQIILNADRLVFNAKTDKILLSANKEMVIGSEKVLLQSQKYKVYLDDLMEYINDMNKIMFDWATGAKQFTTSAGPTATATNVADVTKLHKVEFMKKFKKP